MSILDPALVAPEPDAIYEAFTGWAEDRGLTPYPAQADALLELVTGSNVILATPTGSGKSLVATGLEFATSVQGGRTFYTAPIKALVSEKFFAATEIFGAERVGMMTGDASVNADADDHLLHGGGAGQPRAAAGTRGPRRGGGDGRVPLLRRSGSRLGLAAAAAGAPRRTVPADVGDAGRRDPVRAGPDPADRPRHGGDRVGRASGPAALRVGDHARCTRRSRSGWSPIRRRCTSCTSAGRRRSSRRRR